MSTVKPTLRVLTPQQIDRVHHYALAILSEIGVRVDGAEAMERLAGRGCRIRDNHRVVFPEEVVRWALDAAPRTVPVFNRLGEPAFVLGGDADAPARFGTGVTNLYFQDPLTDTLSPFQLAHAASAARLTHKLTQFDCLSTPGVVRGVDPKKADLAVTVEMVANTTKPLVLLVSEHGMFDAVLDLVDHLAPGNRQQPFVIPYVNPITPLVMNTETLEKVAAAVRRGLPLIYNNYGMSGATAPITPGGTLALLTAELLAGLVFAQAVRPGTPFVAGSLPAGFDMRRMMSVYTPHTVLLNLACAEVMAHYGLPHSGTSGSGPGWGPDLIADGAFWMNHLTACLGTVGLAPFVGGNLDSMAFSPAAVVCADEVIRQARILATGFELTDAEVGLAEMAAVGPGGNFLEADATFERCREISHESAVWPVYSLDAWQERGNPEAGRLLREHTAQLLKTMEGPDDRIRLRERGYAFIGMALPEAHQP